MSGDVTIQSLKRLSHLPDSENPATVFDPTVLVAQENPATGQMVYTYCNLKDDLPMSHGTFIKPETPGGTNYQKVYWRITYDSPKRFTTYSVQAVKVFA